MIDFKFLRHMAAVFDGVPAKHVRMADFLDSDSVPVPSDCGTVACAFGWMAMHPDMKARGIEMTKSGSGVVFIVDGQVIHAHHAGKVAFGLNYKDFWRLFQGGPAGSLGKWTFRERIISFLCEHDQTSAQCVARGEEP